MNHTPNYNFNIPEDADQYNRDYYNENFEKIDTEIQRMLDIVQEEEEDETNDQPGA